MMASSPGTSMCAAFFAFLTARPCVWAFFVVQNLVLRLRVEVVHGLLDDEAS